MRGIISESSFAGWKKGKTPGFLFVIMNSLLSEMERFQCQKTRIEEKEEDEKRREFIDDEKKNQKQ